MWEGFDAGAKAAIIATVAFGSVVVAGDVYREGISRITLHDIEMARRLGYAIKAIAVAERTGHGTSEQPEVAVRAHPAMVPMQHPLASVRDSFNAVFIQGDAVGELMFYGRGAGGRPTASAVLGDLVDAAVNLASGGPGRIGRLVRARIRSIDDLCSRVLHRHGGRRPAWCAGLGDCGVRSPRGVHPLHGAARTR